MCGLSAMIALHGESADASVAGRMADTLRHRGPDDSGAYTSGPVAFGFRRLKILDLSPNGHQPFVSDDGQLALVFNGEVYNYLELRAELLARGHRFRSTGDTEVLLHAYQEWGRECLPRLNGMWAFLIYDRRRGVIFGARDRFGVKPLYRYDGPGHVLFASEIKALLASGHCPIRTNWGRVAHLLCRGDDSVDPSGRETFYEGISQVPAGSGFELHLDGRMQEWRYWSLDGIVEEAIADPPGVFRELFDDAVRLRMRSDVPVGVSLSGGLDSTSIAGAMARLLQEAGTASPRLKAFSYMAPEFDESDYIRATTRETGAELYCVDIDPGSLWERLDEVLWYHDEPVHSGTALVGFEIYRLAANHGVKVVLSGQGADEAFAGYPSYFLDYWCELLTGGAPWRAWSEIDAYCARQPGDRWRLFAQAVKHAAKATLKAIPPLPAVLARRRRPPGDRAGRWFSSSLVAAVPHQEPAVAGKGFLDAALRRSIGMGSLPLYLRIEDRNSMAHSVEARLPFVDYRLVSLAFRLPSSWKLRGPWNKYVLRQAMHGRIPESVRTRVDKMGFPTPVSQWFRGAFYESAQDVLASEAARTRGIYDVRAIRADLERHHRGEIDAGGALFNVVQVERWM